MARPIRIALIPAYEPEITLIDLAETLKDKNFFVLIVDDGSSEEKKSIFQKLQGEAVVLTHEENKGKGRALKTGLSYIQEYVSEDCIVVTVDADGQHTPEDAKRVCMEAEKQPGSMILGSRKIQKNTPFKSRFGNRITRFVYRAVTGNAIYDTQTGLRAFDRTVLPELLNIPGERYEYEMNVLLQCAKRNIPMKEVKIETIYENKNAASHFHPWKDSCKIYKEILKFSMASFLSFLLDYGLYSIFLVITGAMAQGVSVLLSNAGARIISAGFNYKVNQKLVFQSRERPVRSAVRYGLLALVILAVNTAVLETLVKLGVNQHLGKLCTELILFILSWYIQRNFIFRRRGDVPCFGG